MSFDIYNAASSIIESAFHKEGSLKHLCYSSKYKNKKKLFALVFETVKHKKLLEKVAIETVDIWSTHNEEIVMSLQLVLLYETILGRGVPVQSTFRDILHDNHDLIVDVFKDISQKNPNLLKESKKSSTILPRYVRVNTLKVDTEDAINMFLSEGYQLVESKKSTELEPLEFLVDNQIPDLLVFCSDIDLHAHPLYKEGKIVLQDKASCLPAFLLQPPPQSFIIDACAAPGNKSSHLASLIGNEGVIYSFDLDSKRFDVMNKLLRKAGATCVQTRLKDFLKVDYASSLYSQVDYILVDPSCSGSGIVSRLDDLVDDNTSDTKRLKGLSGFQTAVLSHALTFPKVKKVVYSTCSVHQEENENVVEKACNRFSSTFDLVHILPEWSNRGTGEWGGASKCIRAIPEVDNTNGFFVAMFERKSNGCPVIIEKKDEHILKATKINQTNKIVEATKKSKERKRKEERDSGTHEPSAPFSVRIKKKRRKGGAKKAVTS